MRRRAPRRRRRPSSERCVFCFLDWFRAERILFLNPPTVPATGVFETAAGSDSRKMRIFSAR